MPKLAEAIKLKLQDLWDKYHYSRWVSGGCSTCEWPEQSIDSYEYEALINDMDNWIKETYGDK